MKGALKMKHKMLVLGVILSCFLGLTACGETTEVNTVEGSRYSSDIFTAEALKTYMSYLKNEDTSWLYLTGGIGSGKSYFAAALSIDLAKREIKGKSPICFINSSKRILELSELSKQKNDDFKKKLDLYSTVPVLVIDDFGHEFKNDFIRDAIVNEIITTRCNKKLFTIITSNFSLDEIEVLYSTSNAGAIMSKQIVKTIKAMCKKEINLGDLKLY